MKRVLGIDVGKAELVVYGFEKYYSLSNTKEGIERFLKSHKEGLKEVELIVFEATGGYERCLRDCVIEKGYAYHVAHPNTVREFAKSEGYLAKTDKIDAKVLSFYGQKSSQAVAEKALPSKAIQEMRMLLDRREQLITERTREENRLGQLEKSWSKTSVKRHIEWINKELKRIEKELKVCEGQGGGLGEKLALLQSIPGVGVQVARTIIAYLPEIEDANEKSIAALVGVAPLNKDSGKHRGRRSIKAGRSAVRRVLYMGAFAASRYHREVKALFERLRAKGKPYKVAITAVMRKLLIMMQCVLKRGTPWKLV